LDYTHLAKLSDQSRPTVKAHIEALTIANALFLLPPFHGGGRREITQRPKGYAFDTGFITYAKGWSSIRDEDRGILWEHLVLDTLRTYIQTSSIFYWRDKSNREIDFVITGLDGKINTIEVKLNPENVDTKHFAAFRKLYPNGRNFILSPFIETSFSQKRGTLLLEFLSLQELLENPEKLY
jgi:predicted AAA+ superfamily ATPase